MIERFIDDDPGYLSWLADHPDGFVVNSFPHVSSSYLVLHLAACRTVNRPLGLGRRWTHLYGKACSDDRGREDRSAIGDGSYDQRIEQVRADPSLVDCVTDADISAVNRTMRARTSHAAWAPIIAGTEWSWLTDLQSGWELFTLAEETWSAENIDRRLTRAFRATKRPGLGLAVITKVLHIKRPALIPVLDSLVVDQVGARITDDVSTWVAALRRVQAVGRANLAELIKIREHLEDQGIADRTLVRILDALLWTGHPTSGLFSQLDGWERALRPVLEVPASLQRLRDRAR